MPDGLIDIKVTGLEVTQDGLRRLTGEATDMGTSDAADYLAMQLNAYVRNAPYNYVSWLAGGPGPYSGAFSELQHGFIMANFGGGKGIPYQRMQGDPYHVDGPGHVVSQSAGMWYSMSDEAQTVMQGERGWDKISTWLPGEERNIVQRFADAVQRIIQQLFG